MFSHSIFQGDISKWDVTHVFGANGMFKNSAFSGDVSNWKFQDLMVAYEIFRGSPFRGDLSKWTFPVDATLTDMLDKSALCEYAQPSLYHWECAAENVELLDGRIDWPQHYNDSVSLAAVMGAQTPKEIAQFAQLAWLNGHAARFGVIVFLVGFRQDSHHEESPMVK